MLGGRTLLNTCCKAAIAVLIFLSLLLMKVHSTYALVKTKGKAENWAWPVNGEITDTFGTRNGKHHGIDIAAEVGENIYSVEAGIVQRSYYSATYGNVVFINHSGLETVYAHLNKRTVTEGQIVQKGEKIGELGNTGRSSGPHLHFEVHNGKWSYQKENAIDPLLVLNKESLHAAAIEAKEIYIVKAGDTLSKIADNHDITIKDIREWNNLSGDLIYPNQQLSINR